MGETRKAWRWLTRTSNTSILFANSAIAMFMLTQCLDGIFTYKGVSVWGLIVEENPLITWIMELAGVGFGIVMAKVTTLALGAWLYWIGAYNAVATLTIFYLFVVIPPWIFLFLTF